MTFVELLNTAFQYGFLLVNDWGYIGLFILVLISSASLFFFPLPTNAIIITAASILDPGLVALTAGTAASIGDTVSYFVGLGGKEIIEKKYEKELNKVRKFFEKKKFFIWILILSAGPFPIDIVGLFCGMIKYDFRKYFLAMSTGKFIKMTVIAFAGYYSINWIIRYLGIGLIG
ncbi:MAG: VTT domain-containing protein [Candidatus Aenigmarchaeota archaeon]|nr:VTT domain-containing protein [Candidatus Aenigmarchaeota archaeon]